MENLIQSENKMFKSFKQGINLLGIVFLDILVVFIVTYFFDVENFFTNGGLSHLKSQAITIRFVMIISIWTLLLAINYRKAKKNYLFNVRFNYNKTLFYCVPLAIFLPVFIQILFKEKIEIAILNHYQFFLNKAIGNHLEASLNTFLQYLYWFVESLIVIFIIDSFNTFGKYLKRLRFIPWGGIGLALTWGLEQLIMNPNTFLSILVTSVIAGILYKLSQKNFYVVFLYFLIFMLIKG